MLGLLVNVVAAALLALTIVFYVLVYTMWLKRSTPQNIVIGGAAGALPPVIGWAAVTGSVAIEPIAAVPHHLLLDAAAFLGAVALSHRGLRARGRPDAAGCRRRNGNAPPNPALLRCSWRRSALRPGSSAMPARFMARSRSATGAVMVALALRLRDERDGHTASKQLFAFSILYLFLLFAMLLVDRVSAGLIGHFAA